MMAYGARKLYRSRRGKIFGVCQGLADWRNLPVEYIRIFMIMAFIFTGFFPVGILYFLAALILPIEPPGRDSYEEFGGPAENRSQRYENVKREFDDLKERVKDMEGRVFDKEKDWDDRFRKGH